MKVLEIFSKKEEWNYIRENLNNGRFTIDEYALLVETYYKNSNTIKESLDETIVKKIKELKDFCFKQPHVNQHYIPVQINILNDQVMIYDIENNFPAKIKAKFLKLVKIENDFFVMEDEQKNKYTYPDKKIGKVAYIDTILVPTKKLYEQLSLYMILNFDKSLPSIDDSITEKTNPLYLGATEKVANISPVLGSKPKKQKKLMQKFFGSS